MALYNGIRDHVYPELLLPDFALFWSYRQKRKRGGGLVSNGNAFQVHYDSKITYGETVAGVSVGRATSGGRPEWASLPTAVTTEAVAWLWPGVAL